MGLKCTAGFLLIFTFNAHSAKDVIIQHTEYVTEGDAATLRCDNAEKSGSCFTTTWLYNGYNAQSSYELVTGGKINNPDTHVRVTLLPDCSLHISNISTEDAGIYTCRQFINGDHHGDDAQVYLSVVKILVKKIEMGVKLHCSLYNYHARGDCNRSPFNKVDLRWLDDTGAQLREDTKHQIHKSKCDTILTVKSEDTDIGRRFTCQLRDGGEEKISVSYSVPNQGHTNSRKGTTISEENSKEVSPPIPEEEDLFNIKTGIMVGGAVLACLCIIAALVLLHRKRSGNKMTCIQNTNEDKQSATIIASSTAHIKTEKDKIIYCDIINEQGGDSVTYAVVNHETQNRRKDPNPAADEHTQYACVRKQPHNVGESAHI